ADHDRRLRDRRRPDHRPLPAEHLHGSEVRRERGRPDVARVDRSVRRPARRRRAVLARPPRDARHRRRRRRRPVAVALQDEDRDGDPRGRRRRADDACARDQHPEDLRDRVHRRLGARSARGDGLGLAVEHLLRPGRRLAAELARRRDRRRHGLDLRGRGRGDPVRLRLQHRRLLPADDRHGLLHAVLVDPDLRPDRARLPPARVVREDDVISPAWNPASWSRRQQIERGIAAAVLVLMIVFPPAGISPYWSHQILIRTFLFGIAAASLFFLSAYGGMVSLAQTALAGIAGIILGNLATKGGPGGTSKGLHLGWDPTVALVLAIVLTTAIGLIFGAVASRSAGIYFLMITLTYSVIATYTLGQVTKISGFSGIGGINRYTPGWIGNIVDHPNRLYYIALGVAIFVYVLIRYIVRTPFGLTLQGVRDEPVRMASLGYNVPLHRTLAFGFAAFIASLAGVLYAWWSGQVAPGNVDLPETINLLVMAVIGGLLRIEGAWIGA